MASDGPSEQSDNGMDRPQDPIVERLRPDPTQPPIETITLMGFLGNSDRPGHRRVYFTRALDYYAEFAAEHVLHTAAIPPDQHPFPGEEATQLTLHSEATIEYGRTRTARPPDNWDLDVRFAQRIMDPLGRRPPDLLCGTMGDVTCGPNTPQTCQETCQTCLTDCGTCYDSCPHWPCDKSPVRR